MKISFVVPGNPQGKARPRVCRINGKSITYTPKKTVEYESMIRARCVAALAELRSEFSDIIETNVPQTVANIAGEKINVSNKLISRSGSGLCPFDKNIPLEINILACFAIPKKSTKKFSGKVPQPSREQGLFKQKEMISRAKGSVAGRLSEDFKQSDCATCPTARWPTKKPDCDNIIKAICDALNGVAYYDDSQICKVYFEKKYAEIPCVQVEIKEILGGK